jgi:dGTPase
VCSSDLSQRKRLAIRLLINRLVNDAIETSLTRIKKMGIHSVADIQKKPAPVIALSETYKKDLGQIKKFLFKNLYQHYRVVRMTDKGQRFIKAIFQVYLQKPAQLPPEFLKRGKKDGIPRVICDYIAGMTDRFAQDEYKRFFEPYERV